MCIRDSLSLLASFSVCAKTPQGVTYDANILRVSDGDTVVIAAPFLPPPLKQELAIRIFGVDTPENGFAREYFGDAKQSWCN